MHQFISIAITAIIFAGQHESKLDPRNGTRSHQSGYEDSEKSVSLSDAPYLISSESPTRQEIRRLNSMGIPMLSDPSFPNSSGLHWMQTPPDKQSQ